MDLDPSALDSIDALRKFAEASTVTVDLASAVSLPPGPPFGEHAGHVIGNFTLIESIGEGGFGTVWRARQTKPVDREVALKIIKLGMDTREVVARFEQERQALAMMDHPNIAKVFDAGATPSGRPYFVMELVHGTSINLYCDAKKLSIRARLALFGQVCQAVQHAHQKGVIHRDLKPSNILVVEHDGVPSVRVIDFGVAKATERSLTSLTLLTQVEQVIGTPGYMSPEQTDLRNGDIDTRSDVYSLGAVLYELLTGTRPLDEAGFARAAIDVILRRIREEQPPVPSRRITTLDASRRESIAVDRALTAQRLPAALRGDLDWIVMKCLEKDRSRRYDTVAALAVDLQRHLDDEPITARPPSASYRFRKMVLRNRLAVGAAAVITVVLIAGLAGTSTGMVQARRNEVKAVQALHSFLSERRTTFDSTVAFLHSEGYSMAQGNQEVELFENQSIRFVIPMANGFHYAILKEIDEQMVFEVELLAYDAQNSPLIGAVDGQSRWLYLRSNYDGIATVYVRSVKGAGRVKIRFMRRPP